MYVSLLKSSLKRSLMYSSFLQAQIVCSLCSKHNGLLQAKLVADKVTHTDAHICAHTHTHISSPVNSLPLHRKKRERDKGGREGSTQQLILQAHSSFYLSEEGRESL